MSNDSGATFEAGLYDPCQWAEVFTGGTEFSQIEQQAFEHRIDDLTIHSATDALTSQRQADFSGKMK